MGALVDRSASAADVKKQIKPGNRPYPNGYPQTLFLLADGPAFALVLNLLWTLQR